MCQIVINPVQHDHLYKVMTAFASMYQNNVDFLIAKPLHKKSFEELVTVHEVLKNNAFLSLYPKAEFNRIRIELGTDTGAVKTCRFDRSQLSLLKAVLEVHARLGLNQFEGLMAKYSKEDSDLLTASLTGNTAVSKVEADISWDMVQAIDYYLATSRSQSAGGGMQAAHVSLPVQQSLTVPLLEIET